MYSKSISLFTSVFLMLALVVVTTPAFSANDDVEEVKAGKSCMQSGATQLSTDRTAIVACLFDAPTNAEKCHHTDAPCSWKSMSSGASAFPEGHYCVLQNGLSCPAGFTSTSMSLLVGQNNHDQCERAKHGLVYPATVQSGASYCYQPPGYDGHYVSSINILQCCK